MIRASCGNFFVDYLCLFVLPSGCVYSILFAAKSLADILMALFGSASA